MMTDSSHHGLENARTSRRIARVPIFLDIFAKTFAVLVPVLYVMGRAYADSYYDTLGISAGLMGFSFESYLHKGFFGLMSLFVSLVPLSIKILGALLITVSIYAIAVRYSIPLFRKIDALLHPVINCVSKRAGKLKDHLIETPNYEKIRRLIAPPVLIFAGLGVFWYFVLFTLMGLIFPIYLMEAHGELKGKEAWQKYALYENKSSKKLPPTVTFKSEDSGKIGTGLLVECSADWCSIFTSGRFTQVRSSTLLSIEKIQRTPTPTSSK